MEAFADYAPTIGLLFFFTVFVGIAVWAWHPRRKNTLQQLAHIPLNEDENGRK